MAALSRSSSLCPSKAASLLSFSFLPLLATKVSVKEACREQVEDFEADGECVPGHSGVHA